MKNKKGKNKLKLKIRNQQGITLIALVITIVVLLILVGVSIAMLTGNNGILTQAQKAKTETENATKNEATILNKYNKYLNNVVGGGTVNTPSGSTLSQADGNQTNNIVVQDSLENKIEVPKGFKVVIPENTNLEDYNVENGIIIEDVSAKNDITKGSQFVWIPVGTIKTTKGEITINLDRYTFSKTTGDEIAMGEAEIGDHNKNPCKELASSEYGNRPARNIETFKTKVKDGGAKGFYLGRYEARDGETEIARDASADKTNQVVTKAEKFVYNHVTQRQAATLSREMYGETENFTSDLVNSYAWDTALVFIQKCSGDTRYSQQNSLNTSFSDKGTTNDVKCNIYDMASNCYEWSTETSPNDIYPGVIRGGFYNRDDVFTGTRYMTQALILAENKTFRPLLYL